MSSRKAAFYGLALIVLCVVGNALLGRPARAQTTAAGVTATNDTGAEQPRSIWALSASTPRAVTTVTPSITIVPTETPDRYADLHGTQTALALDEIRLHLADTEQALQLRSDGATSTAAAQITATALMAAINTSTAGTAIANAQGTGTQQSAETQTAVPLTHTAATKTQEILDLRANVKKVEIVGVPILVVIIAVVFAYLGWLFLKHKIDIQTFQDSQIHPDDKGRLPAIPEGTIPGKSKRIVNPNVAHRAVIDPDHDDLTPEQALANTQAQRELEGVRALADSPALRRQLLRKPAAPQTPGEMQMPEGNVEILKPSVAQLPALTLPDWRLLNRWDGRLLPYGADENGKLLTVDPARRPHLMVTGTTGTGKTRYEIRTIVAGALASGWQVIVLGKQVDYTPFEGHPNAVLIPVNAVKEPEKYSQVLRAASEQMFARDEMLTSKKISTWDRYGAPQTLIVMDDYSAAMMMMSRSNADQVLKWALAIAMDGRKYGLNLLLGLQRATWTCISTDLRSQMARITMRVASAHESRVVLDMGGAEALPDRHFLARLSDEAQIIRGAAFAMNDAETYTFLQSRPAQEIGPVDWINSEAIDSDREPVIDGDEPTDEKIRDVLLRMKAEDKVNISQAQRELYGEEDDRGGKHWKRIQGIWIAIQTEGATATARGDGFEPLPGSATGNATGSAA